jgi:cytochrome b561
MTQSSTSDASDVNRSYSGVAKAFHWIIVVLIGLMLFSGWTVEDLPKNERLGVMQIHAGIGIIILILMVSRLAWRRRHPAPALPADLPRWQQIAAKATHHGLYFVVILQPLLGLAMTTTSKSNLKPFGLFGLQVAPNQPIHDVAEFLHGVNAYAIAGLIVLHVAAALYHQFVRRDVVLKRMLPFIKI